MTEPSKATGTDELIVHIDPDIADLIPGFLENRRRDVTSLRQAIAGSDFQAVSFIGHTMKGAGAGYGFATISEIGSSLERGGPSGDAGMLLAAVDRLDGYLQQVTVVFE